MDILLIVKNLVIHKKKGMFYELIYRFVKYNKRWIEQVVIESLCVDESDIGALVSSDCR